MWYIYHIFMNKREMLPFGVSLQIFYRSDIITKIFLKQHFCLFWKIIHKLTELVLIYSHPPFISSVLQ